MRWRKTQGFDLSEDGRDPMGSVTVHGDELPLVPASHPRVTSPSQQQQQGSSPVSPQSLPSTPLTAISTSTLDDVHSLQGTSSTAKTDLSSAKSSSASLNSPVSPFPSSDEKRTSLASSPVSPTGHSKAKAPSPPSHLSSTSLSSRGSGEGMTSPQRTTTIHINSSPNSATTSPEKTVGGNSTKVLINQLSFNPQKATVPTSPQKASPNSPQHTPTSPQTSPSRPPSTVTVLANSRPTSQYIPNSPSLSEKENGSLLVVVNGGGPTSPRKEEPPPPPRPQVKDQITTTTTIPIGKAPPPAPPPPPPPNGIITRPSSIKSGDSSSTNELPPSALLNRKSRKSHSKTNSTDTSSRRSGSNGHEKSKSVTIVVNDQHVTYSNTPGTYTTTAVHSHKNGMTYGNIIQSNDSKIMSTGNGETIFINGHTHSFSTKGSDYGDDLTRPSSSASTLVGTFKGDPDIQYLSGEAGGAVSEETGEAWGGALSGICGVILILGAASFLHLPRLLYEYGAGSFLCAWCAVLLLIGAPLAYLEAGLSQFSSSATVAVWRLVPIARGVGWSTVVVCFYWLVVVIGYLTPLLHYLIIGIVPDAVQNVTSIQCSESLHSNYTNNGDWAVDYFRVCVYNLPHTWDIDPDLTFTWPLPAGVAAVVAVILIVSVCSTKIVASVTGVMAILAILGSTLEFSMGLTEMFRRDMEALWKNLHPFLMPQLDILLQPWVWCAAIAHVFLSLGLGVGLLMNFSSRGAFRFTLRRHLWGLVILLAVITALVSAVTILELTLLADDRGLDVGKALSTVIAEYNVTEAEIEPELTITIVPEDIGVTAGTAIITASHMIAIFILPYKWLEQVVSTIIYFGLWCGGVTTGIVCLHTLIGALKDTSDCLPRAAAAIIVTPFVLGGAIATSVKGGAAVLTLLDAHILTPVVMWPPFTLTLAVTSVYGIHKVRKDFTFMLESTVSWLWLPFWGFLIPVSLLGVIVWACVIDWQTAIVAEGPVWRTILIWSLRALVLLPVPITAVYVVKSQLAYGIMDKVASSLQSSREWGDWGPQDPIEHHNWRRWREDETRPITSLKRRFANRPLTYTHSTLSSESSSTLTRLRNKYQRNGTASIL